MSTRLNVTHPAQPTVLLGVRYFQAGALARENRRTWHSIPGGCNIGKARAEQRAYKIWEQEVYRDADGEDWTIGVPALNKPARASQWYAVNPCVTCAHKYIDDILSDDEWKEQAACEGMHDVADYFNSNQTLLSVQNAIRICKGCPVMVECKDWATRLHRIDPIKGTYGGETERDRIVRLAGSQGSNK